jgi:hypothetical protein
MLYRACAITENGKYSYIPQPSYRLAQLDIRALRAELIEGGHRRVSCLWVEKVVINDTDNKPTSIFDYFYDN